jgi:hypothetical protein
LGGSFEESNAKELFGGKMNRYFIQLWAQSQNKWLQDKDVVAHKPLIHTAGNQFEKRNVQPGDYIYVVTVVNHQLYLIGRLQVDRICSQIEAEHILKTTNLWEAGEHAIAKNGTAIPMWHNLLIPRKSAESLIFITQKGFTSLGPVDGRKLQTIRELAEESAKTLDKMLQK